jgi:hypothetical protein
MPQPQATLGALRSRLRARLGFAAAGAAAGVNQTTLNDFLYTAQSTLYWLIEWARLRRYEDKTIGVDQYLIDYPTTAHRDRIKAISILDNNIWTPALKKGIPPESYTYQDDNRRPTHWEPYDQIEFNCKAEKEYTARIFFIKDLDRFTQDSDRATIDSDLVFIHALGDAKEHYRQPDWKRYADQRDAMIVKLKGKNWGKEVFSPYDYAEEPLVKPTVV